MTGRRGEPPDDRGSATLWAVGGVAALLTILTLIMAVGSATIARHQAAAAADLAALAAASRADHGAQRACARARWVAERMAVRLTRCALHGREAVVATAAQPSVSLAGFGSAEARARAGPAETVIGNSRTVDESG